MLLKSLTLQNFRNYSKVTFSFSPQTTIIIGPNAIGKTNLMESIFLLATGKSFRAEKDKQLIQFGKQVCRIKAEIIEGGPVSPHPRSTSSVSPAGAHRGTPSRATPYEETSSLEIVFADQGTAFLKKKYLVNGVARRRVDFAGNVTAVLFTPLDLELVSGQPGNRRRFLDEVLEQVDMDYRVAHTTYTKALRQRNALLEQVQETGSRNPKLFAYWDDLLIRTGGVLSYKREEFIEFINARQKDFFPCLLTYDKSVISEERLLQYKDAEVGAGVTLVGPHRDDVLIQSYHEKSKELVDVRYFASRGQQRLVTLELKLAQVAYLREKTQTEPLLLLDDIFSELDSNNIKKILSLAGGHQVVITTTHKEFVADIGLKDVEMIELEK
jgi:DNA replication and repair protein RecF